MAMLGKLLVEPFYRLLFGPPLNDQIPLEHDRWFAQSANPPGERALVITAGGVGGFDFSGTALRYLLARESLPYAVHGFRWGHGLGHWFMDLTDVPNRDAMAARLAELIGRFRASQAGFPVFLVGKSGGSGIVVKALEQLEVGSVERVVLLAPALSPDYDLSAALRAVVRDLVVFWSPLDVFLLGLGTRIFGTADRVKTHSAGMTGFRVPVFPAGSSPESECARLYAKLHQVRWSARMAATGHLGGHFGPDSPFFLKSYVVPLLRTEPAARK
jgi:hypothetical protein